jgi:hypothetical protein
MAWHYGLKPSTGGTKMHLVRSNSTAALLTLTLAVSFADPSGAFGKIEHFEFTKADLKELCADLGGKYRETSSGYYCDYPGGGIWCRNNGKCDADIIKANDKTLKDILNNHLIVQPQSTPQTTVHPQGTLRTR